MSFLQTQANKSKSEELLVLALIVILVGLFFSFMCLSEFYNVKFGGQESSYAFGHLNENHWAYYSAFNYWIINLISGLIFSMATAFTLWATIKKNQRSLIVGIVLIVLLVIADQTVMRIQ